MEGGGVEVKVHKFLDFFWIFSGSTLLKIKYASNFTHSSTDERGMFTIWGMLFSYIQVFFANEAYKRLFSINMRMMCAVLIQHIHTDGVCCSHTTDGRSSRHTPSLYVVLYTATHCNALQHTATHCNTLQRTATHCNTLQHTATHCNTLQHTAAQHVCCSHTQHVCCSHTTDAVSCPHTPSISHTPSATFLEISYTKETLQSL